MSRAVRVSSSGTSGSGWRMMNVPPNLPRLVST